MGLQMQPLRRKHTLLAACVCLMAWLAAANAASSHTKQQHSRINGEQRASSEQRTKGGSSNTQPSEYFFYNEVTGETQWEDPGDVPYEDAEGNRFWLSPSGEKVFEESSMFKYAWVEQYSEDLLRPYFYNQETRESTWERPADLAWRRVRVKDQKTS